MYVMAGLPCFVHLCVGVRLCLTVFYLLFYGSVLESTTFFSITALVDHRDLHL